MQYQQFCNRLIDINTIHTMQFIRRMLKLAPILTIPLIRTRHILASQSTEQPSKDNIFQALKTAQVKLNADTFINQQKKAEQQTADEIQQKKQKENQSIVSQKTQNETILNDKHEEKEQFVTKSDYYALPQPTNQQKKIEQIQLKQNQAVVNSTCPMQILNYLQHTSHKLYPTDDPNCKLKLKNKRGDIFTLNQQLIIAQNKDTMQLIANFINPPIQITTIDEARQLIQIQQKDCLLVCSYLPQQQDYDKLIQSWTRSMFDTFTTARKVNLTEQQHLFTSLAYNSSSNKNTFVIARSKEVADYLKINTFNIGVPYILNKTTKQNGNQSNSEWQGQRYHVLNLAKQWKQPINKECINHITHLYINKIDSEQQAYNKIRQMQMSADPRKLLLIYTNEHRQEFHNQLDDILEKVARTEKERVVVFKTQNKLILRNLFRVQPESFTTVRLFNLNQTQAPLFGEGETNSGFYSRSKLKGPFKYQNICNLVNSNEWEEHYQSKKRLTHIKTVRPEQLKKLDNTLVLMEKEGCHGCKYVEQSLDELKKITKALSSNPKIKKNLIYRYKIEDPNSLLSLRMRRYSIFNESMEFTPPSTTPKLFLFSQGKFLDLKGEQSLGRINQVKNDQQAMRVHDLVLSDIINRIRLSQEQKFTQF